jgi:pimeloyl-ACP methyl ester carboxylesterase
VLWGASDGVMAQVYAERWGALIPQAKVVVIPEAEHMLPYQQPEAFCAALGDFLG